MPASAQHASGGVGERGKRMRKQQPASTPTTKQTKKTGSRASHHGHKSDKPKTEKTKEIHKLFSVVHADGTPLYFGCITCQKRQQQQGFYVPRVGVWCVRPGDPIRDALHDR